MILLDIRELDHPVPLEMAVDAFKKLHDDDILHIIHRREPIPLFEIITKNGGRYFSIMDGENIWHIYITRSSTVVLEHTHV